MGSTSDILTGMVLVEPTNSADTDNDIVLSGYTNSTNFPTQNAISESNAGKIDAFVAKLDRFGGFLHFSTYLGGKGDDYGLALAVDRNRDIYVAGPTDSTQFPIENAPQNYGGYYSGAKDGFLVKLGSRGLDLESSFYFGGTAEDAIQAIACDPAIAGVVWVAGNTKSTATTAVSTRFPQADTDPVNAGPIIIGNKPADMSTFVAKLAGITIERDIPVLSLGFFGPSRDSREEPRHRCRLKPALRRASAPFRFH